MSVGWGVIGAGGIRYEGTVGQGPGGTAWLTAVKVR
jgi:hypothetical protein